MKIEERKINNRRYEPLKERTLYFAVVEQRSGGASIVTQYPHWDKGALIKHLREMEMFYTPHSCARIYEIDDPFIQEAAK